MIEGRTGWGGLLTAVWVPDTAHEAMRDLIRARQAAVRTVRTARQQLSAFLLRHERVYPGNRTPWTKAHRGWLADQSFAQPAQQIVLEESIEAVRVGEQRRDRVDSYLRVQIPSWSLFPLVQNLIALRGLDTIARPAWRRPLGDPSRFASAPDFMAYLGVPRSNPRKFWRHSIQASRSEFWPVDRPSRPTFPKMMLGGRLLMAREARFSVIKVQQLSPKGVFLRMFGSEAHRVRSKMTMSKISRV
jgi:hypothetical protein